MNYIYLVFSISAVIHKILLINILTHHMILFFESSTKNIIAVGTSEKLPEKDIEKLIWLFGDALLSPKKTLMAFLLDQEKR